MIRRPIRVYTTDPADTESTDQPGLGISGAVASQLDIETFRAIESRPARTLTTGFRSELQSSNDRSFELRARRFLNVDEDQCRAGESFTFVVDQRMDVLLESLTSEEKKKQKTHKYDCY